MKSRPWYSWLLFALVVVAVGWFIYRNVGEIRQYDFSYNLWFILLSFIALLCAYLVQFGIWISLSRSYGLRAPILQAGKGFFVSQLGKYIPGKVGLVLVRMEAYRDYSRKNTLIATGVEFISSLGAACLLVVVGILSASEYLPPYAVWVAVAGLLAVLIFLLPPVFRRLGDFAFRLIKRAPMETIPPYGTTLKYLFAYILPGLLNGLGLFFILRSLTPVSFEFYLTITSVYYAAGLIGLAALFAPAGLGVREGIMMLVLPLIIAGPAVIVGVLLIRLIMTAVELTLAGVFSVAEKFFRATGGTLKRTL